MKHPGALYAYELPAAAARKLIGAPPADVRVAFVPTNSAAEKTLKALGKRGPGIPLKRLVAEPKARIEASAYAPGARARALLQGIRIAEADLKEAGGTFDLADVQALLNDVTRQAIEKRVKEGSLLAVPGASNRRRYPTMQFTRDGVVPGLKEVQAALPTSHPWAVLNFFVRPDDRLGGRKPIDVLREGDVDLVVSAARGVGVQGG